MRRDGDALARTLELLAYGVCLSVFAVIGGQVGARLDAHIGSKRAVQIEILAAACGLFLLLGMGVNSDRVHPLRHRRPRAALARPHPYKTLPEVIFLAIGLLQRRVRHRPVRIEPHLPDPAGAQTGQSASFFGLYALVRHGDGVAGLDAGAHLHRGDSRASRRGSRPYRHPSG